MVRVSILLCFVLGFGAMSPAQSKCNSFGDGSISGLNYSNSKLGLSYTFPAGLSPQNLRTVPPPDQKTDSMYLLLLWKTPKEFEKPSIIVMTEDASAYPDPTALGYVHRIETTVVKYHSAKILKRAQEYDLSGLKFYRLDYQFPGDPLFNTAITGQFAGCEISFNLTARKEQEIEDYVRSLATVSMKQDKPANVSKSQTKPVSAKK
ncbi:MAG: hypothetical protein JWN45_721 [Acidobacteriaceae bacterium]|nr:hypothetical protein [Acidobacteriaceae bacterium]